MGPKAKHTEFLFPDFTAQLIGNKGNDTAHYCQQKH